MNDEQYPNGRVFFDTVRMDGRVFRMDTLTYSMTLAQMTSHAIEQSGKTKQQIALTAGIPRATFCRRLDHPEKSFLTIPETILICDTLNLEFVNVLSEVKKATESRSFAFIPSQFKDDALAEGGE